MIDFQGRWRSLPAKLRQIIWFIALWIFGVTGVTLIAFLLKIPLSV